MMTAVVDAAVNNCSDPVGRGTEIGFSARMRALKAREFLFRVGDQKRYAYRVETGAVAVIARRAGRPSLPISIAGQGEYVGLGCLSLHAHDARAVVDTTVTVLERSELAELEEKSPALKQLQAQAIHREFEDVKSALSDRTRSTPAECIAAFLAVVSRQNEHEGRNPAIISDDLKCGLVAELLNLEIDTLEQGLHELEHAGLIEPSEPTGLRLKDVEALATFSDGVTHRPTATGSADLKRLSVGGSDARLQCASSG